MPETANLTFTPVTVTVCVRDLDASTAWVASWLGRAPDLVPTEGIVEWRLNDGCWLQLAQDERRAGASIVRLGVQNLDETSAVLEAAGVALGDVVEFGGFLRMRDFTDPDDNRYTLIQELG